MYTVAQPGKLLPVAKDRIVYADSLITAAEALRYINMDSSRVVVMFAQDTSLIKDTSVFSGMKGSCAIAFIGCDETHFFMSEFVNYFYSEYLKTNNSETAFLKAKTYLFDTYPDSPVIPILNCKK